MRKYFIFLVLVVSSAFAHAQIRSNRDLVGKWQGGKIKLEFFNDQRVAMVMPGGQLPMAHFTADFMQNPVLINITLTDNGQQLTYKGNLKFIDNEHIELEYFEGAANNVFEKGRKVTLEKIK